MESSHSFKPRLMLLLATVCWGLSFPVMKALVLTVAQSNPGQNHSFVTAFSLALRFGLAAVIVLVWARMRRAELTPVEWRLGAGLGLFGGAGLYFQMDALNYISASTSAFLTQFYCLIIPLWISWRNRSPLRFREWVCCALVLGGVACLSQLDWQDLSLGRGEWETLLGSAIFAAQILWLERKEFISAKPGYSTLIMFSTIAGIFSLFGLFQAGSAKDFQDVWRAPGFSWLILLLALFCTLTAYGLMNVWQRYVTATEAGLIYCAEPIFATVFAIVFPPWLSQLAKIDYTPETLTANLLIGGSAITLANICFHLPDETREKRAPEVQSG